MKFYEKKRKSCVDIFKISKKFVIMNKVKVFERMYKNEFKKLYQRCKRFPKRRNFI